VPPKKPRAHYVVTPAPQPSLTQVLSEIKNDFDTAAMTGGHTGLTSLTRSARPITRLHQHVADLLVRAGIAPNCVDLEVSISTLFGDKRQDVVAIPRGRNRPTGASTLSVGLKGQMYGIQKNLDNHFSSVRAELLNLHEMHGEIVCGHVHLVNVMEWDTKAAKQHRVAYKKLSPTTLAAMVHRYGIISGRQVKQSHGFAERLALVLVDFSQRTPVVYTDVADLERDEFLPAGSGLSLIDLTLDGFADDLVAVHRSRYFGANRL